MKEIFRNAFQLLQQKKRSNRNTFLYSKWSIFLPMYMFTLNQNSSVKDTTLSNKINLPHNGKKCK